ncbi:MAG: diaminopimelate decarboxylase, partial [Flavobacteriales bacterium]|nr:diaminopimelate decarboxylase [Flavobacteriales bacterium]
MMRPSVLKEFGKHETPFYYYDLRLLRENIAALQTALAAHQDFRVHYALKANFDEKVLRIISAAGLGADCVSGGEVQRALDTGFAPSKIVFAGVGKSDKE